MIEILVAGTLLSQSFIGPLAVFAGPPLTREAKGLRGQDRRGLTRTY